MDQPATPQLLSVDETVPLIIECLKEGHLRQAAVLCAGALDADPGHPDALHYSGVLAHKLGRTDDAVALMQRSLERAPGQADWHSNLGIVLQATGDFEAAIAAFRRAIELDPAHANAHANLGVLLRAFHRFEEAEAEYRTAIALNPNNAGVYHNLAILLDQTGRTPEALTAYCTALTLNPSYPGARRNLALAYSVIGRRDKAIEICEEWVQREPDNPRAHHALAAYSGRNVPRRASNAYVEAVFNDFAEGFEAKLARLQYQAPALVVEALGERVEARGNLDVLDLGCGTGLCGPLLAPYARRLVGVDLSTGMLDHARVKQVYDELVHAELTVYLQQQQAAAFDVIVSADTLVYFGALDEVIVAAAAALRPGGVLIFTVEEAVDRESTASYRLEPHGRYTHRAEYVEQLLASAGLTPRITRRALRNESGSPVAGLVVQARKALDPIGDGHA